MFTVGARFFNFGMAWLVMVAGLAVRTAQPQETGEKESPRHRRVADSDLPQGQGLAAGYAADMGIERDPAVIFADDFESGAIGEKWEDSINPDGQTLSFAAPPADEKRFGNRILKVTATLGENTGGALTRWFESSERLFVRFYTKFDEDCDYIHHFCSLRANKSLQGSDRWSGFGKAGKKPDGTDRFSTNIEPWGNYGRWPPPGRWNFYSYWHTMEASGDGNYWGNGFRPADQPDIQRGEFICVEIMLLHNTPGQDDGEQAYWIDGELRGHWQGINWRTSPSLWANSFSLESYVTERWTKQTTNVVYFDNVVVGKRYIGPSTPRQDGPR